MKKQNKLAFTLVELIVVITILAILATIAFISLQGYSKHARDSKRIADISNIKTSLELFSIKVGKYPTPTDPQAITYSGGLAWYQGTFGNDTYNNVGKLNKLPVDPLTGIEYTYSLLNTYREYELGGIIETQDLTYFNKQNLINQTIAGDKETQAIVKGTYNGISLRVNLNDTSYILAIPTIITSIDLTEESNRDLETIITNKELVLQNYTNLPSNYKDSNYKTNGEEDNEDFEPIKDNNISKALIYEGNIDNLTSTGLIEKLQEAYDGTTLKNNLEIAEILSLDLTSLSVTEIEKIDNYGVTFINNNLGGSAEIRIYNTCEYNNTIYTHNTIKTLYTSDTLLYGENCDTIKKDFTCIDGIWKNGDEILDANIYAYESCSVEGPVNCEYNNTMYTHNTIKTLYTSDTLSYGENCDAIKKDFTCTDGTWKYGDEILDANTYAYENCSVEGPVNCEAGEYLGYTHGLILHGESEEISMIDSSISNGTQTKTGTLTCDNGNISLSNEILGDIICDDGYYSDSTTCEPQWSGDSTNGYIFKNVNGETEYPTSCNNLLTNTNFQIISGPYDGTNFSDGIYYIQPSTSAFQVYCDMTTDGGGWMLISKFASTDTCHKYCSATGTPGGSSCYHIGCSVINSYISTDGTEWRIRVGGNTGYRKTLRSFTFDGRGGSSLEISSGSHIDGERCKVNYDDSSSIREYCGASCVIDGGSSGGAMGAGIQGVNQNSSCYTESDIIVNTVTSSADLNGNTRRARASLYQDWRSKAYTGGSIMRLPAIAKSGDWRIKAD